MDLGFRVAQSHLWWYELVEIVKKLMNKASLLGLSLEKEFILLKNCYIKAFARYFRDDGLRHKEIFKWEGTPIWVSNVLAHKRGEVFTRKFGTFYSDVS